EQAAEEARGEQRLAPSEPQGHRGERGRGHEERRLKESAFGEISEQGVHDGNSGRSVSTETERASQRSTGAPGSAKARVSGCTPAVWVCRPRAVNPARPGREQR